jgi:hypothetical protein
MSSDQQAMVERARADLERRLGVSPTEITEGSVEQTEFPDAALGAPVEDEMSAQVITPGWRIRLVAKGRTYEYRATQKHMRLFNFSGENYRI